MDVLKLAAILPNCITGPKEKLPDVLNCTSLTTAERDAIAFAASRPGACATLHVNDFKKQREQILPTEVTEFFQLAQRGR